MEESRIEEVRIICATPGLQSNHECRISIEENRRLVRMNIEAHKVRAQESVDGRFKQSAIDMAQSNVQGYKEQLSRLTTGPQLALKRANPTYQLRAKEFELCLLTGLSSKSNVTVLNPQNNTSVRQSPQQAESQQLQAAAQQAQASAANVQQRADADAQRRGRRVHDPAAEAHDCLEVDAGPGFGGFRNKCNYPVSYGYCVENPRKGAWTDTPLFSCAGLQGRETAGGQTVGANGFDANHTKGGTAVHYFACRQPASVTELTFDGSQIVGRCRQF